jgi:hypothetical protein
MPIAVVCSNCSAKLNAPDGAAGKKVKCPKCQSPIVVPDIQPMQFEVVEDEPAPARRPAGKPTRVKAAVEDDDDDRPRRKRRSEEEEDDEDDRPLKKKRRSEEDDEDDDDRPRKKKRRREDDDEDDDDRPRKKKRRKGGDEEGGVSMTRNIVMGVVLIILVAVAAYIFYDRNQKQQEEEKQKSSSNAGASNTGQPDDPGRNTPLPKGDVAQKVGGGEKLQPATLTSPKGYSITFPGPFRLDEALAKKLAAKSGLDVVVYKCDDQAARKEFRAIVIEFNPSMTSEAKNKLLDVFIGTLSDLQEGKPPSRHTVSWNGRQWEELVAEERQDPYVLGHIMRLLSTDQRLYALGASQDGGIPIPSTGLQRLFDSFKLTLPGWTPDPKLIGELTQKGELAGFQVTVPQKYVFIPNQAALPPHLKMAVWAVKDAQGLAKSTVSILLMSGTENVEAAGKNIRQFLVNSSAGYTDGMGIKIASRGPTESGIVNGLAFSRFAFTAIGPNQMDTQGLVYGAIDVDRVVMVIGMGFGEGASDEIKVLESIIATLKKT